MGITIHYSMGIEKARVKTVLDRTEAMARQMAIAAKKAAIPFELRRSDEHTLRIDIGRCETLSFEFKTERKWMEKAGWSYVMACLPSYFSADALKENENHLKDWPEQRTYWCAAFCKTQFAESVAEHRMVAELVRSVAQYASYVHVNDEGDYYHTGKIDDAAHAISELGQMMNGLTGIFKATGYTVKTGGETKIRPLRAKRVL